MEIIQAFNTNTQDIAKKQYNIFIPICIGNDFFIINNKATKNVEKYIQWALDHTKNKILILIADKIQDTNIFVRNKHRTLETSQKRVLSDGKKIKENIKELVNKKFSKKIKKIKIINYNEFEEADPNVWETTVKVYKEFKNNPDFKHAVIETVKTTQKDRKFTEDKYLKLSDYILDEFSLIYSGIHFENIYYQLFLYPKIDSTVYLIENIQKANLFEKLNKKLPLEKSCLLILNNKNQKKEKINACQYYNNLANKYETILKSPEINEQLSKYLKKLFIKHKISKGNILDIGCGPGNLKTILKELPEHKFWYTGIEISKEMIKKAQKKGYKKVLHGKIEEIIPILPAKSFDYVIANSSLYFIKDINFILENFERIARKGIIFTFDKVTNKYQKSFKTFCNTPLFNHYKHKVLDVTDEIKFTGWTCPRTKEEIKMRLIYKKISK